MTHVPYTINVPEYVCSELERMRTMIKTHDFSGLEASVERVQYHVSSMERALEVYSDIRYSLLKTLDDENLSDAEKLERVREATKAEKAFRRRF